MAETQTDHPYIMRTAAVEVYDFTNALSVGRIADAGEAHTGRLDALSLLGRLEDFALCRATLDVAATMRWQRSAAP